MEMKIGTEIAKALREWHDEHARAGKCAAHDEGLDCCFDVLIGELEHETT